MGRSRDIAGILGKSEAENANNLAFLNTSSPTGVDSAQVQNIGLQAFDTIDSLPINNLEAGQQAYVTGTNRLYVSNGSGWFNVALINASPSLTISPSGAITLATDGTPTTITLTATDSDGPAAGITFSVESDGSFAGLGTISQDSSVFTITPKLEDSATTTSSTLTFKASDGINFGSGTSALSLTFAAGSVENSRYTTLLAKADASAGVSQIDHTGRHTLSYNGSRGSSPFTPYNAAQYSHHFNGNTDSWDYGSDTGWNFGSGDFTIEAWFFPVETGASTDYHIVSYGTNSTNFWAIRLRNAGNRGLEFRWFEGSEVVAIHQGTDYTVSNEWAHVAVTREGNNFKMFLNGTQVSTTQTNSGTISNFSKLQIGDLMDLGFRWKGYIRDVRLVKGTAVYTSNFTPPTEPLEKISGTELLACAAPHMDDISDNRVRPAPNGNPQIVSHSPYDHLAYTDTDHIGSSFYAGSGGQQNARTLVPGHADFNFGTGDYTIEMWYYPIDDSLTVTLYDQRTSTQNYQTNSPILYIGNHDNKIRYGFGDPGLNAILSPASYSTGVSPYILDYKWWHIAVCRNSGTTTMYLNGKTVGSFSDNYTMVQPASNWSFGGSEEQGTYGAHGHISDLRVVKGAAVYTGEFTPPTTALGAHSSGTTVLQSGRNETMIYDIDRGKIIIRAGNAAASTTERKFSTSDSIYFDGSGDFLRVPSTSTSPWYDELANLAYIGGYDGTSDFTLEGWWYFTTLTGNSPAYNVLWSNSQNGTAGANMTEFWVTGTGVIEYYAKGSVLMSSSASTISTGTWHHIALTKQGTTQTIWVDGNSAATTTSSTTPNIYDYYFGDRMSGAGSGQYPMTGYLQDLRITRGLARYTTSFTPPTTEFEG